MNDLMKTRQSKILSDSDLSQMYIKSKYGSRSFNNIHFQLEPVIRMSPVDITSTFNLGIFW